VVPVTHPIGPDGAPAHPVLPRPRGPLTDALLRALARPPHATSPPASTDVSRLVDHPLDDDDLHLALYCCYELHYRGFAGVDVAWEWDPGLLAWRGALEAVFLDAVRCDRPRAPRVGPTLERLRALLDRPGGPSLSSHMATRGTVEQMREFCVHRSAYQLKEADPHTWAIPRLTGVAKASMVAIQADEYGAGHPADVHATLFAGTMAALGLDPTYGAYLDLLPGTTLATVNLVSLLGLHRRWRAAAVGHLAAFEMTSVEPMGRYAAALERMGIGSAGRRFYDVHVEADVEHERVAAEMMVVPLVRAEPELADDVIFGAEALLLVEDRFTRSLLGAWAEVDTSLLAPAARVGAPRVA
jgi:hypothetical protein